MTALSTTGVSSPSTGPRRLRDGRGRRPCSCSRSWSRRAPAAPRILGEVLGSASNADAHHITAPSPGGGGAVACMELAPRRRRPRRRATSRHINAHGTSTPLNDAAEAEAIAKVFGPPGPPVTSTKGVTGHALGAAGAARGGRRAAVHRARPDPAHGGHHGTSTPSCPDRRRASASPGRGSPGRRCRTPSASAATTAGLGPLIRRLFGAVSLRSANRCSLDTAAPCAASAHVIDTGPTPVGMGPNTSATSRRAARSVVTWAALMRSSRNQRPARRRRHHASR